MVGRRAARLLLLVLLVAIVLGGVRASYGAAGPPPRVEYALRLAAATYRVPYPELRAVSYCESRWRPGARGDGSVGLFQFLSSTWRATPYRAFSRRDPVASALAAAWLVTQDGGWGQWACRP